MSNSLTQSLCGMLLMLAPAAAGAAAADTPLASTADPGASAWLNVQEMGASGSEFETTASTTAGSREVVVENVGDFRAGQEVVLSRCNPGYTNCVVRGPVYGPFRPLESAVEMRGYDGSSGSWTVFILEVNAANPLTFRWSDDLSKTWKGTKAPITFDWQPLSGGTEIRFKRQAWEPGLVVSFHARDTLVSTIEKIEGNVLTLRDAPNRSVKDAVVRHCDGEALQAAIDRAVKEKRNVFFPAGHYRLIKSLTVLNPSGITLEGANGADTVLDVSEGNGGCIRLAGGSEVTLRNFCMVGHTGLGEGPGWRGFAATTGWPVWPQGFKPCNAVSIRNTGRVLIENCHASKMNSEAFYCQGDWRSGAQEPKAYTKSITYLRCSATNCDGNAFNNNDLAENTSVLYCRIVDVGGCSWEGASRFVRFIGNYLRNAGPVAMGNIGMRAEHLEQLGSGQHIVADNVFEGRCFYAGRAGRPMVTSAAAAQVIITNNLFVNFNSNAIALMGISSERMLPAEIATVRGNIFDMTCQDPEPIARTCIDVGISGVLVSDNQIYVRGESDPTVTAIRLKEPAVNLNVHDNLIRNSGTGIATARAEATIAETVDQATFLLAGREVPLERRRSHRYRGWNLAWLSGAKPNTLSVIEAFDPETLRFKLRQPHDMQVGDRFQVFPPSANWSIHDNTITGCLNPVVLDSHGSATSLFKDNLITRGGTAGVKAAIAICGSFNLIGNHVSGFDEKDSAALSLAADPLGRTAQSVYRANVFQGCAQMVPETQKDLWDGVKPEGNITIK